MVVQNFRVLRLGFVLHNGVHLLRQGMRQLMGLALTEHLGEITLRVNIHKQNPFAVHGKPRTDAVDTGAFADAALLVGDGDHFAICHFGIPPVCKFSCLRRWRTAM